MMMGRSGSYSSFFVLLNMLTISPIEHTDQLVHTHTYEMCSKLAGFIYNQTGQRQRGRERRRKKTRPKSFV
jgi:hypothetical protein